MPLQVKPETSIRNNRNKKYALLYLIVALMGLTVFAFGSTELHLQPGQAIPMNAAAPTEVNQSQKTDPQPTGITLPTLILPVLLLISTILFLVLVSSLIRMQGIKKIMKLVFYLAIPIILLLLLNKLPSSPQLSTSEYAFETAQNPINTYAYAPLGDPPQNLSTIITIALLLILAAVIVWALGKRRMEKTGSNPIADEIETALKALTVGDNLENVIINCYMRMSSIIIENQGIERESYLTPREFESMLNSTGIPLAPIHQLTTLFEKVRYGKIKTSEQDEKNAIACLSELKEYFHP